MDLAAFYVMLSLLGIQDEGIDELHKNFKYKGVRR